MPIIPVPNDNIKLFRTESGRTEIFYKQYGNPGVMAFDPVSKAVRGLPFPGKTTKPIDGNVLAFTKMGLLANDLERLYLLPRGQQNFIALPYTLPANGGWFNSEALPDGGAVITGERGYLIHFKPGERTPDVDAPAATGGGIEGFQDGLKVSTVDQWGRAWMRSSGGFCIFDPRSGQFQRFAHRQAPEKYFSDIRDFCPDNQGRMWCIGPDVLGWIDAAHPENGIQKRYSASNGFDFRGNWSLRVDWKGRIWFTSFKGIIQFFPETESYRIYSSVGKAMEFFPDGNAIFSYWTGISYIPLDSIRFDTLQLRPYATWFKIFEKERPLEGNLLSPQDIWLAPDENFISIGFSLPGFSDEQTIILRISSQA
ncbi:MAG: hypothetical protein IPH31_14740 [Lewinellaceae bacterium]|nr:hypothetical protein [Lewinellaceae bacterium]